MNYFSIQTKINDINILKICQISKCGCIYFNYFLKLYSFLFLCYLCASIFAACACSFLGRLKEGIRWPCYWSYKWFWASWCRCWEPNLWKNSKETKQLIFFTVTFILYFPRYYSSVFTSSFLLSVLYITYLCVVLMYSKIFAYEVDFL